MMVTMKLVIVLSFFLFGIAAVDAETPHEVAERIISSQSPPAYNPVNKSEAELNRAAAINSELQLQYIMLGNTVSEKLRVCYALYLIKQRFGITRVIGTGSNLSAVDKSLVHDREILAAYLRKLNVSKN